MYLLVFSPKCLKGSEDLRYDELATNNITVSNTEVHKLEELTGDAIELEITFTAPLPAEFGLNLLADENGKDGLTITAGANNKSFSIGTIEPPFELENGEDLSLRIFIDKNLVEVFANNRQAAVFTHEHIRKNPNISLFTNDADVHISKLMAWKMKSIYNKDPALYSN